MSRKKPVPAQAGMGTGFATTTCDKKAVHTDMHDSNSVHRVIRVQREDFDAGAEMAALGEGRTDVGAVASFVGLCRDEGGRLAALELEHYPGMAEAEIGRVADEAIARWPLLGLTAIHRHGKIGPGEQIVFVACASSHRQAAFEAAEFMMDFLKTSAPFWKREHLIDGTSGSWVAAKDEDDERRARWQAASQ
ncbi:Molybdopterin synthase catalytic subunit [Hartmannibacter diazotrophicus]|uniref:Molybdopterin synthase catalytic subunit n=2 Tax=Hartmannibacter diazotrophicus TaxID=1482074 RepID=A0A2C9D9Y9_9HYPH|nr:Molybdopterin synthase catalytic subunit [Hartmannibacter diazotrophicus]